MIVSSRGCSRATRTCAAAAISSSPGMRTARRSRPDDRRSGSAARQVPPDRRQARRPPPSNPRRSPRRCAPSARNRTACCSSWARHSAKACNTGRISPGIAAPAPERPRRQAAVEQQHRNAAAARREHQIGPQLGFDPDREIGTPMVEKPIDGVRQVDRARTDAGRGSAIARRAAAPMPRFRSSAESRCRDAAREADRSGPAPSALRRHWRHVSRSACRAAGAAPVIP